MQGWQGSGSAWAQGQDGTGSDKGGEGELGPGLLQGQVGAQSGAWWQRLWRHMILGLGRLQGQGQGQGNGEGAAQGQGQHGGAAQGDGEPEFDPLHRLTPALRQCWERDAARRQLRRRRLTAGLAPRYAPGPAAAAAAAAPDLLSLSLPGCLPTSLTSLSLSRVAVTARGLGQLGLWLPSLSQLSLEEFELDWEHLLALGTGPGAAALQAQLRLLAVSSTLPPAPVASQGGTSEAAGAGGASRGLAVAGAAGAAGGAGGATGAGGAAEEQDGVAGPSAYPSLWPAGSSSANGVAGGEAETCGRWEGGGVREVAARPPGSARALRRAALAGLGGFGRLNYLLLGLPEDPATGERELVTGGGKTAVGRHKEPATWDGQPITIDEESSTGDKEPATGDEQPTADSGVVLGMDLLLLRPALAKLKGLTLQAPKGGPCWSSCELEELLLGQPQGRASTRGSQGQPSSAAMQHVRNCEGGSANGCHAERQACSGLANGHRQGAAESRGSQGAALPARGSQGMAGGGSAKAGARGRGSKAAATLVAPACMALRSLHVSCVEEPTHLRDALPFLSL